MGCTGPTRDYAVIEDVSEISTHPSSSQLQEKFRVPCAFRSTVWGVRRLTTGEIVGEMDLPPGQIVEAFSRAVEQSKVLLTSFLNLPPVEDLQFDLDSGS